MQNTCEANVSAMGGERGRERERQRKQDGKKNFVEATFQHGTVEGVKEWDRGHVNGNVAEERKGASGTERMETLPLSNANAIK